MIAVKTGRAIPSQEIVFSCRYFTIYQRGSNLLYSAFRRQTIAALLTLLTMYPKCLFRSILGHLIHVFVHMLRLYQVYVYFLTFTVYTVNDDLYFVAFVSYMEQVVGVDMPPNQLWFCRIFHLALYFGCLCGCHLLVAMTFERFYSIVQPHKAASFNTVRKARIIVSFIFMYGFLYSTPYLVIASNDGRLCIPNAIAADNVLGEVYGWLTETILFVFPFLSLLIMNSVIIHSLRNRSQQKLLRGQGQTEGQNLKSKSPEKQIITMLLLVTFAYLCLNIPVRILVLYLNFSSGESPSYFASIFVAYQVEEKIYYTNHAINIFLYVISGQRFRTDLKNLFMSKKSRLNASVVINSDTRISAISATDN